MTNICLNMIVKNEEAALPRLLESVVDHISCYVIVDTGSTDGTREVIERYLGHLPGVVRHSEFENFSQARNVALTEAEFFGKRVDYDYLLLADADMELVGSFPETLDAPAYYMWQRNGDLRYQNLRLVAPSLAPIYDGVTHEVLHIGPAGYAVLDDPYFIDHADGSNRVEKYERDIRLLMHDLADDPDNTRSMFYLAQSFKDVGNPVLAKAFYEHRATMGGWDEEVWYSLLMVAALTEQTGSVSEVSAAYKRAHAARPWRAEALRWLARYLEREGDEWASAYDKMADKIPYPNDDRLFIDSTSYKT